MPCTVTGKDHRLQDIMSKPDPDGADARTVRWCCDCGGVVIDVDIDGRVMPGQVMPMKFPRLALENRHRND